MQPTSDSHLSPEEPPADLKIDAWPLRDDRGAKLAAGLAALVAVVAGVCTGNFWIFLLVLLALAVALWRAWLPISFHLSTAGIVETLGTRQRRIAWRSIGKYRVFPRGVMLLPDVGGAPLGAMRGIYLPAREVSLVSLVTLVEYYVSRAHLAREVSGSQKIA